MVTVQSAPFANPHCYYISLAIIYTSAARICLYDFDLVDIVCRDIQNIIAEYGEICMVSGGEHSRIGKSCSLCGSDRVQSDGCLNIDCLGLSAVRTVCSSTRYSQFQSWERIGRI